MSGMRDLVERMRREVLPRLDAGERSMIEGLLDFEDDIDMACDAMLQFSANSNLALPEDLLTEAQRVISAGDIDPALSDRSQGWLDKHVKLIAA